MATRSGEGERRRGRRGGRSPRRRAAAAAPRRSLKKGGEGMGGEPHLGEGRERRGVVRWGRREGKR